MTTQDIKKYLECQERFRTLLRSLDEPFEDAIKSRSIINEIMKSDCDPEGSMRSLQSSYKETLDKYKGGKEETVNLLAIFRNYHQTREVIKSQMSYQNRISYEVEIWKEKIIRLLIF